MKYFEHSTDDVITHYFTEDHKFSFTDEGIRYDRMMEAVEAGEAEIVKVDDTPVPTWQDKRIAAYGSWGEQLDMMYHGTWKDHVASVKAEHPKP